MSFPYPLAFLISKCRWCPVLEPGFGSVFGSPPSFPIFSPIDILSPIFTFKLHFNYFRKNPPTTTFTSKNILPPKLPHFKLSQKPTETRYFLFFTIAKSQKKSEQKYIFIFIHSTYKNLLFFLSLTLSTYMNILISIHSCSRWN